MNEIINLAQKLASVISPEKFGIHAELAEALPQSREGMRWLAGQVLNRYTSEVQTIASDPNLSILLQSIIERIRTDRPFLKVGASLYSSELLKVIDKNDIALWKERLGSDVYQWVMNHNVDFIQFQPPINTQCPDKAQLAFAGFNELYHWWQTNQFPGINLLGLLNPNPANKTTQYKPVITAHFPDLLKIILEPQGQAA